MTDAPAPCTCGRLPALEERVHYAEGTADANIARADAAEKERDEALGYATRLLVSLIEKHYPDRHPDWAPWPTLIGVLTQLDNMSTGLTRERDADG